MKLYHYWRSSSSWRVRLALEHKGIKPQMIHVGLLNGESESKEHLARNPAGFVPVLELDDGTLLTESVAICEYLEEISPKSPLLPKDAVARARVRAFCETVNSGIQPLHNPTVVDRISTDPKFQKEWAQHWISRGLGILEKLLPTPGTFCWGETFTLADCFLVPQVYGALRYEVDLRPTPKIAAVYESCLKNESVRASHPDRYKPADF